MTRFAKRGFPCTITNIEKFCFEILITDLENAWCLVHEILHQFIQGGVLFNGWLAELSAILDRGGGENTLCSYTCIIDPPVLKIVQK